MKYKILYTCLLLLCIASVKGETFDADGIKLQEFNKPIFFTFLEDVIIPINKNNILIGDYCYFYRGNSKVTLSFNLNLYKENKEKAMRIRAGTSYRIEPNEYFVKYAESNDSYLNLYYINFSSNKWIKNISFDGIHHDLSKAVGRPVSTDLKFEDFKECEETTTVRILPSSVGIEDI